MIKKKRTTYLLIGVIAIYAAIVVRFYMLSNDRDSVVIGETPIGAFTPTLYETKKEFTLDTNYRDPFLGTVSKRRRKISRTQSPEGITDEILFPDVTYLGIISDAKSSTKVLSLKINNREYVIREGTSQDSLYVISGTREKLIVSYKGRRKEIKISG